MADPRYVARRQPDEPEDLSRIAWRETKVLKAQARELRYEHKVEKMQLSYARLRAMEQVVIEEGRTDFNADEIYEMLFQAYFDARDGKRKTYDVQRVEANLYENLYRLATDIAERRYFPTRSEAFIVYDPVIREIFAASFRDRIVHHLVINICMPWWNRHFVRDSYSCRVGKGTDYGVRRAAHHIAVKSRNYTERAFFVKMDIKGFFMSMERERLCELAIAGAHQQFRVFGPLGRMLAYLWRQIIMDEPLQQVRIRSKVKDWSKLPRDKSLFFQSEGRGIVIGNLTSQLLSNILLDALDKFIIYQLGYHHYGRYVDDFYIVVNEEESMQLIRDMGRINAYLLSMGLTMHPYKTRWCDVRNGVHYLGKCINRGHIEVDRRYQQKYYQTLLGIASGAKNLDSLRSYMGGCVNYGCRKMQEKIWRAAGQEYGM